MPEPGHNQAGDEGAEERLPAAPGVVDELEEAEIGGQLLLRDALWVAQLYAHVFVEEHVRHRLGPERGVGAGGELRVVAGGAEVAGAQPGRR